MLAATLALLAALPAPSAQAGPIRRAWPAPALARPQALRADAWPRLTRSALPMQAAQAARGNGGPMAAYLRQALQSPALRVNTPPAPRAMQLAGNGMLPDAAFLDYLQWRRSLNPARFDRHHPALAQVLRRGQFYGPPVPVCPPPVPICPPPAEPQAVRPSAQVPTPPVLPPVTYPVPQLNPPPQVPEPSSGLVLAALFGAGWWVRRWRSRRGQESGAEAGGAVGGNRPPI